MGLQHGRILSEPAFGNSHIVTGCVNYVLRQRNGAAGAHRSRKPCSSCRHRMIRRVFHPAPRCTGAAVLAVGFCCCGMLRGPSVAATVITGFPPWQRY
jgi:hypothetical protein